MKIITEKGNIFALGKKLSDKRWALQKKNNKDKYQHTWNGHYTLFHHVIVLPFIC